MTFLSMYKNKKQTSQMARLLYLFRCYSGLRVFRLCNQRLLRSLHCVSFPTAASLSNIFSSPTTSRRRIQMLLRLTHLAHNYPEKSSCKSSEVDCDNCKKYVVKYLNSAQWSYPACDQVHWCVSERCNEEHIQYSKYMDGCNSDNSIQYDS